MIRRDTLLIGLAALLAFCVITLGAYVRLSDAGLGCPDWPGCYGHLTVPEAPHEQAAAVEAFPDKPVETHKAWKEMVHRYAASTLGLLILVIAIAAWRRNARRRHSPLVPTLLVGVVVFQGLLGMWTVTLLLKPVIVTAHLLGGMSTLALLLWLFSRRNMNYATEAPFGLRLWALLALTLVFCQIALGGWVSSNYAALSCPDFPVCQGSWLPETDFNLAFQVRRELGQTAAGDALPGAALTAIHLSHRAGALLVALLVGSLALTLRHQPGLKGAGNLLLAVLVLQISLGISNVVFGLPLFLAVAHNGGGALLLGTLVIVTARIWPKASAEYSHGGYSSSYASR